MLFAQKGEISGKVTDSTNDSPLIGANVVIEGTDQGAATAVRCSGQARLDPNPRHGPAKLLGPNPSICSIERAGVSV